MSFNKLHCKKCHVAVASRPHALVININDVWAIDFGGVFGFGSKFCDNCGIFSHTRLKYFERDFAIKSAVDGSINSGHATVCNALRNVVKIVESGTKTRGSSWESSNERRPGT